MARSIRDSNLETRTARGRLAARGKPYWRLIEPGLHLGYRKPRGRKGKPAAGGAWVVRVYVGGPQAYKTESFATADDYSDADGVVVLDFRQAQDRARKYRIERVRPGHDGPLTVEACLDRYLQFLETNRKSAADARWSARAHIIPQLGDILCSSLSADILRNWLAALAKLPPRVRSKPGKLAYRTIDSDDEEAARKRRASANRVWGTFRASLAYAYADGLIANDTAWRRIKPFRDVNHPRPHYLTPAEAKRLINACDKASGFRDLVRAALLTGCRYGELCRLVTADCDRNAGVLHIRTSKSGRGRNIYLSDEGRAFFGQLATGKSATDFLLTWHGRQWKKNDQILPLAAALRRAHIGKPGVTFHSLRHSYASALAAAGTPILVTAKALGHASTRMTEKYYTHLEASYEAQQIRAGMPDYGFKPDRKLAKLP